MYIHGYFKSQFIKHPNSTTQQDINDNLYNVEIWSDENSDVEYVIDSHNDIVFDEDPVSIDVQADDIFSTYIETKCTINVISKIYLGDYLFAANPTSIKVIVTNTTQNRIIFAGFVTPASFNQDYVSYYDSFSIECSDVISTLQNQNYLADNYDSAIAKSVKDGGFHSFQKILSDILTYTFKRNNTEILTVRPYFYSIENKMYNNLFLKVNDLVFLGESADDHKVNSDVIDIILKYLCMQAVSSGDKIIITHKSLIDNTKSLTGDYTLNSYSLSESMKTDIVEVYQSSNSDKRILDDNFQISIDDIYTQIKINANRNSTDTPVDSFLNDDNLDSDYPSRILYMREYISDGEGHDAIDCFKQMLQGKSFGYDAGKQVLWYMRKLKSTKWKLSYNGVDVDTIGTGKGQQYYMQYLKEHNICPCLLELSSLEEKTGKGKSNGDIESKNCLLISINGNGDDTATGRKPSATDLSTYTNLVSYINKSSVSYVPNDEDTTYYLVFTGKLTLVPRNQTTYSKEEDRYNTLFSTLENSVGLVDRLSVTQGIAPYTAPVVILGSPLWHHTVPSDTNDDGRYYAQQFFLSADGAKKSDESTDEVPDLLMMTPNTGIKKLSDWKYTYSKIENDGDTSYQAIDNISKLQVLWCSLRIGDKYLEEYWVDDTSNKDIDNRKLSLYRWVTDSNAKFTIGVDPKIDDNIIGDTFELTNNISAESNIDTKGMAIPIKKSDKLVGTVDFKILSPVDVQYDSIIRTHKTLFRSEKFNNNSKYLLSHIQSIIIEGFDVKIYNDNGGNQTLQDKDLVYLSDDTINYLKNTQEIDFDICSGLTSDESYNMKVSNDVYTNSVINSDNTQCITMYDQNGNKVRAEESYINFYYPICSTPHKIFEATIESSLSKYNDPMRQINFYQPIKLNKIKLSNNTMLLGYTYNLKSESIDIKTREI